MESKLIGVVAGSIGHDPFGERTWSGTSRHLFQHLSNAGLLQRAFGAKLPRHLWWAALGRNVHPSRELWRLRLYTDPHYRDSLAQQLLSQIHSTDHGHDFLQIGASFNVSTALQGKARCFAYHDGNFVQALRSPLPAYRRLPARRIEDTLAHERALCASVHKTLTTSEYLRQSFIDDFGAAADRVVHVGAGLNVNAVPDLREDKRYDSCEVLFVGVAFERKGGPALLRAFNSVRAELPQARLHIVGPRKLSIPVGLERGVSYHGFLNKADAGDAQRLEELYQRCALFVMPSVYEPFGVAPLEAMAHGIPCLVTDGWALRESVTPGINGQLVEPGQEADLREKLLRMLKDPAELQRMGQRGRERVLSRYTWPHVVQRIRDALR